MTTQKIAITNALGLHARPASLFVKAAAKFSSDIQLFNKGNTGIAKSILSVLALSAECGDIIEIKAEGKDEKEAVATLVALIQSNFGEA